MRLVAAVLVVGCRHPCPPTTVIYQSAPTQAQATTQPAPAPDPIVEPIGPVPDLSPYPSPKPTSVPSGGTQAAIAARLQEEGDKEYTARRYENATAKFRDAIARVPEAKYFYSLCRSLFQEGKFREAMAACRGVQSNFPSVDLQRETDAVIAKIRAEARAQGIDVDRP